MSTPSPALGTWTLLDGCGLVTTAEWRSPSTYERLDHSHAYATIALPGDRTA